MGEWWEGEVITEGSANGISDGGRIYERPSINSTHLGYLLKTDTGALISAKFNCNGYEWYKIRLVKSSTTYEGYIRVDQLINVIEPETNGAYYNNELGRASFTCSLGDWNPDWDVFIATSWQVDENGNEIPPNLYRDTELTLSWEYFGFEKNLFKPEGYFDGIYLWNPRTWSRGDINFTFQELIRVGT